MGSSTDVLSLWYDTWKFLLFFTFLFNPWPPWLLGKNKNKLAKSKKEKVTKNFQLVIFLSDSDPVTMLTPEMDSQWPSPQLTTTLSGISKLVNPIS